MSPYTLSLLADLGALLLALGLLAGALLLSRADRPRPRGATVGWILVGACALLALVFAAIVLIVLLAG